MHKPIATAPPEARVTWHTAVDWDAAGAELGGVLSEYLQVDNRNPPGRETVGAEFLAGLLEAEGIPSRIIEHEPGRGSLIARLEGSGEQQPLCLLSHIDTATWDIEGWPEATGPLSGAVDENGVVWGRGALDMKGLGAVELMTMIWLKRLGVPLTRDVVLLAVADEEVGNHGARYIAANHWDEIGCSHMINEGGIGIQDAFFDGQTVYAISVAEKGVLWVKMIATGEPGHGSTPMPDEAPARLIEAIERLEERPVEPTWNPATYELLFNIGQTRGGPEKAALTHPSAVRSLLKGRLLGTPATAAMITNTVHLTGLEGANEPNVVPSEVAAILDCRLQPDIDPQVVLDELKSIYADQPWIRFEVIHQLAGNGSPWDDPFYAALVRHLEEQDPSGVAGPIVSVGFTDSIVFRPLGVRAYGIAPFSATAAELSTMHGHGERVSLQNLQRGLRVIFSAVVDVSAAEVGSPPGEPMGLPMRPEPEEIPVQEVLEPEEAAPEVQEE